MISVDTNRKLSHAYQGQIILITISIPSFKQSISENQPKFQLDFFWGAWYTYSIILRCTVINKKENYKV